MLIALLLESWVLTMKGCAWNDSVLVLLMAAVITYVVWNTKFDQGVGKTCLLKGGLTGSIVSLLFLAGVLRGNISDGIIISRLLPKTIIVFMGSVLYCFVANTVVMHRQYRTRDLIMWGIMAPVFAAALWGQGLVSW